MNQKTLKKLEKKEREIIERLKNTYDVQNKEIKRMETVMNESKQGFYQRKPASPEHHQQTQAKSNGGDPNFSTISTNGHQNQDIIPERGGLKLV
jgi:uncharacterized protein (DUF305 family)